MGIRLAMARSQATLAEPSRFVALVERARAEGA
jgi:hypothetical protein